MTSGSGTAPPRLARAILALLLPSSDRRFALADLEEEFEARMRRDGGRAARTWYRSQMARSLGPVALRRVRGWWRTTGGRGAAGPGKGGGAGMGLQGFVGDVRYALRTLARAPLTVLITIVSLGMGLGAVTTVFAMADGLLYPPAPWLRNPQKLVTIYTSDEEGRPYGSTSYADFEDLRSASALADAAASNVRILSLDEGSEARQLMAEVVTGNFFSVTGIRPVLGRAFASDETRQGSGAAVGVISYALWSERFGGDPGIVGRSIRVSGRPLTVIGVAPKGVLSRRVPVRPDVWIPLSAPQANASSEALQARGDRSYVVIGRLSEGADLRQLRAQLAVVSNRIRRDHPREWTDDHGKARTLTALSERQSRLNPQARKVLSAIALFFFAATGLVLLIACANVTSLFLVRAVRRGREVALRLSLGATRLRVVRMLLTEGLLLGLAAGMLGLGFAELLARAVRSFSLPINVPIRLDLHPGAHTYVFAFGVALLTSAIFSVFPALRVSRTALVPALKGERGGWGRPGRRFKPGSVLVGAQFAASLVLLVGAGLFLRSLQVATKMDLGLDPAGVAVMSKTVPDDLGPEGTAEFYRDLRSRLVTTPEAQGAALSSGLELTLMQINGIVSIRTNTPGEPEEGRSAFRNAVTPGYLKLLGIHMLRGRTFTDEDVAASEPVAVVNETFARTLWPNGDAVGRSFILVERAPGPRMTGPQPTTVRVVGIAADGSYSSDVGEPPTPYLWTSLYQDVSHTVVAILKGASAEAMARELRARVDLAPGEVPVMPATTYTSQLSLQFMHLRIVSRVLVWGGAFGLLLALMGVYGLVSFTVAQRTREIAIRRSVGADSAQVVRRMVRHGLVHALVGLAVGLLVLVPGVRLIRGLLVGVGPADPVAVGGGVGLLLATAFVASLLPARRAARIDPMTALRQE